MTEIRIRPARPVDTPIWRDMRARLYGEDPSLLPEIEEHFAGGGRIPAVFVADCGEVVGFVELGIRPYAEGCTTSPVAYLEGLYVDEAHRRSGIGRMLVAAAEHWAITQGFSEIASDALIENGASLAAHTAYGFDEVERIICFRKSLTR